MKGIWLIKAGGELLAEPATRKIILSDLARLRRSHPIVFVHGGGPQIESELAKNNIANKFLNGRRVTSPEAMVVVERTLSGQINKGVAGELTAMRAKAVGLSGRDGGLIVGKPIEGLERAASPSRVDPDLLLALLAKKFLPVVSTVAGDSSGAAVNINADDAASALAISLKAENLVFLTNVSGVLDQNKKRIPILKTNAIDGFIRTGVIQGGMIPKVQSARAAIQRGVGQVTITDGRNGVKPNAGTVIKK